LSKVIPTEWCPHDLPVRLEECWVSPYGCPEDGQQAYDKRANSINQLSHIIESIEKNFDV